jgi:flagellar basal body P-ring formation protein FlgA
VLGTQDLSRISTAFGLGWTATPGDSITLRRAVNEIDHYAMEAAVQERIAADMNGAPYDIEFAAKATSLQLPEGVANTAEVKTIDIDLQKGRFTAQVGAANADAARTVTGRIFALTQVPVLKNALRAGDIIDAHDIEYVDIRAKDIAGNIIMVGQSPRRGIAAGKMLTANDIVAPVSVKKGEMVTVILKTGVLSLTMQAKALQSGATGDTIRIINTNSNRALDATVTGAQTVTVTLASAVL